MKLNTAQRNYCINKMILDDIEASYKLRDRWWQFYEGITPYKDMTDDEIVTYFEELEMPLPSKNVKDPLK